LRRADTCAMPACGGGGSGGGASAAFLGCIIAVGHGRDHPAQLAYHPLRTTYFEVVPGVVPEVVPQKSRWFLRTPRWFLGKGRW
jgi:hypothetical protein